MLPEIQKSPTIGNPGVVSIKKICDGLEISVREFFDCPLFDDTEQEIK